MRPNWFVGQPVRDPEILADLPEAPPRVRLFAPEDLHITVAFLGGVDAEAAHAAFELASDFTCAVDAATLGAVHPMGPPRRASALSFWLEAGRDEVAEAIGAVRDAMLERAGARRERRPPLPHLTIARIQRNANRADRHQALRWAASIDAGGRSVRLAPLALYTWAENRRERQFQIVDALGAEPASGYST